MAAQEVPRLGNLPKLLSRVEVAEGTMAFHFEKPPGFDFKPGQSADLTLLNPPETDSEGNTRTFSIASAPFENHLIFVTRMRDTAFKRSLKKLPLGVPVKMDSATGSFALHKNSAKPAVFLAGGIGITPFFSIVRQANHDRAPHQLYLFYSNRRPEDAPFLDPLQKLETTNPWHDDRNATLQGHVGRRDRFYQQSDAVKTSKQVARTYLLHRRPTRHGHRHEENAGGIRRR